MRLLTASIFLVAIATAGCKNTGVKSISGLETERISRFIDSKNSLGQEIHASPIDLVREQLTWESNSPNIENVIITPLEMSLEKIYSNKNCIRNIEKKLFECTFSVVLNL